MKSLVIIWGIALIVAIGSSMYIENVTRPVAIVSTESRQ